MVGCGCKIGNSICGVTTVWDVVNKTFTRKFCDDCSQSHGAKNLNNTPKGELLTQKSGAEQGIAHNLNNTTEEE